MTVFLRISKKKKKTPLKKQCVASFLILLFGRKYRCAMIIYIKAVFYCETSPSHNIKIKYNIFAILFFFLQKDTELLFNI